MGYSGKNSYIIFGVDGELWLEKDKMSGDTKEGIFNNHDRTSPKASRKYNRQFFQTSLKRETHDQLERYAIV